MTIANSLITGNNGGDGGGLYNNDGTTTITDSTITDNTARSQGGGLYNDTGTLTVINSTVSGNRAGQEGGGLYIFGSATVTNIVNSTISGNVAGSEGGGIYQDRGTLTITNSTITGNTATTSGGGLYLYNDSPGAVATIVNSIISGNTAVEDGNEIFRVNGTITADAYNVFGDNSQTNADAFDGFTPGGSDLTATSDGTNPTALAAILDTTLADNGGPTETHALVAGSPAIDFAPTAACAADPVFGTDQRGEPRSIDIPGEGNDGGPNLCDSGAYEVQIPPESFCPIDPLYGTVGTELTTLLGTGMGSPTRSRMVAKITIPNSGNVVDLYGQMAGKEYNGVKFVRFIFGDKSYQQVQPETDLGDTGAISWWGADLDESKLLAKPFVKGRWFLQKGMKKMRIPRAIVFYPTYDTGDTEYANAWSTFTYPDNFVAGTPGFDQSNTNVLMIPETQAPTDIVVQIAVTDVNRDARTVDVTVTAGNVSQTVTLTGPTTKKSELLNIFEVTLEGVPAGVDEVEIELVSVLDEGDSAALLGAAASYVCEVAAP